MPLVSASVGRRRHLPDCAEPLLPALNSKPTKQACSTHSGLRRRARQEKALDPTIQGPRGVVRTVASVLGPRVRCRPRDRQGGTRKPRHLRTGHERTRSASIHGRWVRSARLPRHAPARKSATHARHLHRRRGDRARPDPGRASGPVAGGTAVLRGRGSTVWALAWRAAASRAPARRAMDCPGRPQPGGSQGAPARAQRRRGLAARGHGPDIGESARSAEIGAGFIRRGLARIDAPASASVAVSVSVASAGLANGCGWCRLSESNG